MLKIFNKMTILGIATIILGFYLVGSGAVEFIYLSRPAVNLYESTDWSILEKGTHISTDIDFIDSYFYNRYDDKTGKETSRVYLIPNLIFTEDEVYIQEYIGIMAKAEDGFGPYESAVQSSIAWWFDATGEAEFPKPTLRVNGYLREMKDEEKESLVQFISDNWSISAQEAEQYICPYVIVTCNIADTAKGTVLSFVIVLMGFGTAVWGVISGIRRRY